MEQKHTKTNESLPSIKAGRRGLLRTLLGAGFAAPVISTFSMDSLMGQTPIGVTLVSNTINTSNTTGCRVQKPADKATLTNEGYVGAMYFQVHASDLTLAATYYLKQNLPLRAKTCTPAEPTRLTIAVGFEIEFGGRAAAAIRQSHFYRPEATITLSEITVDGQSVAELIIPSGRILPTSLKKYGDLNALLEDMSGGRAMLELRGFYQGKAFTLIGDILPASSPFKAVVLTA